jgi:CelD/BcsL family acetyltransferase involved in cellulose biosynthesis
MAQRGHAHVFQLKIGGAVVATRVGFSFGRTLYLYYSGYDPAWAKYSVMTTAVAEAIKWAIARGFDIVNLSTGNDVSKTRWGPEEKLFHSVVLQAPTARARLATRLYRGLLHYKDGGSPLARLLAGLQRGA